MTLSTRARTVLATTATTALLATTALGVLPGGAAAETSPRGAGPDPVASWVLRPGAIGPLVVGMSDRQLVRTGVFTLAGPKDPCGAVVKPKVRYRAGFNYAHDRSDTRLAAVQVVRGSVETSRGISVGDTLRDVRQAYPGVSKPRPGVDGDYYVVVRKADRFLSIGVDDGGDRPDGTTPVYGFAVSKGGGGPIYLDGCGY